MFRCPGQDQRLWKPEDIFEVKDNLSRINLKKMKGKKEIKWDEIIKKCPTKCILEIHRK